MNLIITCARHLESETQEEIKQILRKLGDDNPEITITNMQGILTVNTRVEPLYVVKRIKEMILEEPWSVRYCLRIIPIQSLSTTNVEAISIEVLKLIGIIKPQDSYRITIEKRNSNISTDKIISKIAKNIPNKVSLDEPDWIVLVEILGSKTGIAILKNSSILSVEKTKRSLSD